MGQVTKWVVGPQNPQVQQLDSELEARREAVAWAEIARKLNNIYTDYAIAGHKVEVTDLKYAPGWTDMKDVYLSEPYLTDLRKRLDRRTYLAVVKGLSFHELFHLLYSPRGQWRKDIARLGLNTAWNALEDQRIESLGTVVWPRMGRLIAVTVAEFILKGQGGDTCWPLLIGRRYLPIALRNEYRAKWQQATSAPDTVADELESIVAEYVGLVHPADNNRAFELVSRFAELLGLWKLPDDQGYDSLDGHTNAGRGSGARPARKQRKDAEQAKDEAQQDLDEQRKARADKADDTDDEADEADEADDTGGDAGTDAGDAGDGDTDDSNDAGTDAGDDTDGDADDTDADGAGSDGAGGDADDTDDADDTGDNGTGEGAGGGKPADGDDTDGDDTGDGAGDGTGDWNDLDNVQDLLDSALDDYADEINDAAAALDKAKNNLPAWVGVTDHWVRRYRAAAAGSRTLARKITKVLRKAQDDAAAGRLRGQRSGRINVRKAGVELADPKGNRDLYDRWVDDAAQDVSAEVVVLVDTSGSTRGMETQYAEALWVLKKGLEDANVPTTVATFDNTTELLWRGGALKGQAAQHVPWLNVGGGTNPSTALHEARQQLRRSDAAIRMIVVLTDGAWGGSHDVGTLPSDTTVAAANADGITTVLIGFCQAVKQFGTHNCQYARDLTDPRDMVPLLTAAINRRMVSALKNRES